MRPSSNNPQQKQVVMAFGTFDYFHAGHENYLAQAKALGTELVVILAKDQTVQKVKGQKPLYSERKRLRDVSNCKHVSRALIGYEGDKYKVIRKVKPDIIALGYDQFVFTYGLQQLIIKEGLNTKIVRLKAFEPQTFKSSIIKNSTCAPNLETNSENSVKSL
jgi:FAD synthetase